jgi:hypothetical protein
VALIPLTNPYVMNSATLTIAADDFTAAVSQVQLDPTVQSTSWRSIGGSVRRGQSKAEWDCTLGLAQDLDPDGLLRYLLDHDGETVAAVLTPEDGGPSVNLNLILAPATIGGPAGADLATSSTKLAVDGTPVFVDVP